MKYFGSGTTDGWIKKTFDSILDKLSDAIADLDYSRARQLLSTARELDPDNRDLTEIEKIVARLSSIHDQTKDDDEEAVAVAISSSKPSLTSDSRWTAPIDPIDELPDLVDVNIDNTELGVAESDDQLEKELPYGEQDLPDIPDKDSSFNEIVNVQEEPPDELDQSVSKTVFNADSGTFIDADLDDSLDDEGAVISEYSENDIYGWRIGIDFGTSNTRFALGHPNKNPTVLNIGNPLYNARMMPSVVAIHQSNPSLEPVIGEEALELADDPAWRIIRNIKRMLVIESDPQDAGVLGLYAESIRKDFDFLRELPHSRSASDIAKLIVDEGFVRAQVVLDDPSSRRELPKLDLKKLPITFGIWAAAGRTARETNEKIASQSLSPSVNVVSDLEPSLAARSMFRYNPNGSNGVSLIFDLGGGTFDTCVVQIGDDEQVSVLAADSVPLAGGSDIERSVRSAVVDKTAQENGWSPSLLVTHLEDDILAKESLDSQVRMAMIEHSKSLGVNSTFSVRGLDGSQETNVTLSSIEISDAILNSEIAHSENQAGNLRLFDHILECLRACCMRARNTVRDPDTRRTTKFEVVLEEQFIKRIVLVGGASQFKEVVEVITNHLPDIDISYDNDNSAGINPLLAIVRGAAATNEKNLSTVLDRPAFGLYVQRSQVYTPYTSTFKHEPNQIFGGITAKTFKVQGPLLPGSSVTLTDEYGFSESKSTIAERIHDPVLTFARTGEFTIRDRMSSASHVVEIPNRPSWQLNHAHKITELELKAKQAKNVKMLKTIRTNQI